MIRKFLILLFLTCGLYAQEQQGLELPEFVITGVERVNLPSVTKPKADLVPTLSQEFFKPSFSTEELQVGELSNPVKKEVNLFTKTEDYKGRLLLGSGIYTMPVGEFAYNTGMDNVLFSGKLWGSNERHYINNSGLNKSGIELKSNFFVSNNSGFIPGTRFDLSASYDRESFYFFASPRPDQKRDLHNGLLRIGFENNMGENLKYNFSTSEKIFLSRDSVKLNENSLVLNGSGEAGFKSFSLGFGAEYVIQGLSFNSSNNTNYGFFQGRVLFILRPSELFNVSFGFNFAGADTNKMFMPMAMFDLKIDKGLTFFGEYTPRADFLTQQDLLKLNRYADMAGRKNLFVERKGSFKLAVKYEYETYFEISTGIAYARMENQPYFTDSLRRGIFRLNTTEARSFSGFINMLFHPGPYGNFYGDVVFESLRDLADQTLPYAPVVTTKLSYGYDFKFGIKMLSTLTFRSSAYTDLLNTQKVPSYLNFSVRAGYELFKNFDIFAQADNLFNKKNYYWRNYQEKPLDVIMGIEYRW